MYIEDKVFSVLMTEEEYALYSEFLEEREYGLRDFFKPRYETYNQAGEQVNKGLFDRARNFFKGEKKQVWDPKTGRGQIITDASTSLGARAQRGAQAAGQTIQGGARAIANTASTTAKAAQQAVNAGQKSARRGVAGFLLKAAKRIR